MENNLLNKETYTDYDLEELEYMHNITEIYIWLYMRFSSEFVEKDKATLLSN